MLTRSTKAQILGDIKVALIIHAVFVFNMAISLCPIDSPILLCLSAVFAPQWIAFGITSDFDSPQSVFVLILRCGLGLCVSFILSLLYAATWRSALYLSGSLIRSRKPQAMRKV